MFISQQNDVVDLLEFFIETIISSEKKKDGFIFSFPTCVTFISFSCLFELTRTFNIMLSKSGKSGHPLLVVISAGKYLVFYH